MWGAVVRNAREWVRLTTVYFPEKLHPESLAFVQVLPPPASSFQHNTFLRLQGCTLQTQCSCAEAVVLAGSKQAD